MFDASGDRYDRFMGRYSRLLAPQMADFAGIAHGMSVLDVGCGPGPMSVELAARVGEDRVAAIDPQEQFVEACRSRLPGADVRRGGAEALPWPDGTFDAAVAQLAVSFMADAPAGVREMRRAVREGGTVAFCSWEEDGLDLRSVFFRATRAALPEQPLSGDRLAYRSEAELRSLADEAGLEDVSAATLGVDSTYAGFDELWETYSFGIGPIGAYYARLSEEAREAVREEYRRELGDPAGAVTLSARAIALRGRV